MEVDRSKSRCARIERAIEEQKAFLGRIPDPDTRERAEHHLIELVQMREEVGHAEALRE